MSVDFSKSSLQALEYAIGFAEKVAAKLVVFHAMDFGYTFTADAYGVYDLSTLAEVGLKDARRHMEKCAGVAKSRKIKCETVSSIGLPVSDIAALGEERDVDLINHGDTWANRL